MSKKKIVSKGYTVEVFSCIDSEDYSQDLIKKCITLETKEEAIYVKRMFNSLFTNKGFEDNIGYLNLSRTYEGDSKIIHYLLKTPDILNFLGFPPVSSYEGKIRNRFPFYGDEWENGILEYVSETTDLSDKWIYKVMDYNTKLLGDSEYYYSKVCDKITIFYSPEDVYLEEIS